jgi:hypothetical protein
MDKGDLPTGCLGIAVAGARLAHLQTIGLQKRLALGAFGLYL